MIVIAVLVIMWGVVLTPSAIRRVRARSPERSISSFHHSLEILDSATPKVVNPAFRLTGTDGGSTELPTLIPIAAADTIRPRPQLVLLRPPGQGGVEAMKDRYRERSSYDDADNSGYYYDDYAEHEQQLVYADEAYTRRDAALRRRKILFVLGGTLVVTALGGFVVSIVWSLTIIVFVLLVTYVALMAWAATRGSIEVSSMRRSSGGAETRHVARAVVSGPSQRSQDAWWDDEGYDQRAQQVHDDHHISEDPDEWWERPRRAASR
jgi:hypothetical protein